MTPMCTATSVHSDAKICVELDYFSLVTLVAVGGRPSRVKDMPGSHCRSVTQVV